MTIPSFHDLSPPVELRDQWFKHCTRDSAVVAAARWGARQGYRLGYDTAAHEVAFASWPRPITDRPPTEVDGDKDGWVCYLLSEGFWTYGSWEAIAKRGDPWQHSPRWQPRRPSLQEQALALVERFESGDDFITHEEVEIIRRALEQAGEGKA